MGFLSRDEMQGRRSSVVYRRLPRDRWPSRRLSLPEFSESPVHVKLVAEEILSIHALDGVLRSFEILKLEQRVAFDEARAAIQVHVQVLDWRIFTECVEQLLLLRFLVHAGDEENPSFHRLQRVAVLATATTGAFAGIQLLEHALLGRIALRVHGGRALAAALDDATALGRLGARRGQLDATCALATRVRLDVLLLFLHGHGRIALVVHFLRHRLACCLGNQRGCCDTRSTVTSILSTNYLGGMYVNRLYTRGIPRPERLNNR